MKWNKNLITKYLESLKSILDRSCLTARVPVKQKNMPENEINVILTPNRDDIWVDMVLFTQQVTGEMSTQVDRYIVKPFPDTIVNFFFQRPEKKDKQIISKNTTSKYQSIIDTWSDKELVCGDVRVDLEWIEEGYGGCYDKEDDEDIPLLRFTIYKKTSDEYCGEWDQVDDASYCTQLPITTHSHVLEHILQYIMDEVYEEVINGHSIKKLCEKLSWLEPKDIKNLQVSDIK